MIGFDLETFAIHIKLAPPIVVGAMNVERELAAQHNITSFATHIRDIADGRAVYFVNPQNIDSMVDFFVAARCPIVAHNAAFDFTCLSAHNQDNVGKIFQLATNRFLECTYIRSMLISNAHGELKSTQNNKIQLNYDKVGYHSLAGTLKRFCYRDISEVKDHTVQTTYHTVLNVPFDEWPVNYRDYLVQDVEYLHELYFAQNKAADVWVHDAMAHKSAVFEAPRRATFHYALNLASAWGVKVDLNAVEALRETSKEEAIKMAKLMVDHGFATEVTGVRAQKLLASDKLPITISQEALRSAVQLGFDNGYLNEIPRTDKGDIAVDRKTLASCGNPILQQYAEAGAQRTILNTFVPALEKSKQRNGVLNTRFFPLSETGRVSARDPNLLNPPRNGGVRECIVAREGCALVFADYESNELRVLGQVLLDMFGSSRLADLYRQDAYFDCHTYMACQSLGISYEVGMQKKADKDKAFKAERQRMKCCNFGFPGGMAAITFVQYCKGFGLEITVEEAEALKTFFFSQFPEIKEYLKRVGNKVDRHDGQGYLHRVGRITGGRDFCQLANFYFQGLAAEGGLTAFTMATKFAYTDRNNPLWGTRPILFVHDEIIIESPLHKVHEAAMELKSVMERSMRIFTPQVPSIAEPSAALRWTKDAFTKYDENGRIIPCDM